MPEVLTCKNCAFSKLGCTICELSPTSASLVSKMNSMLGRDTGEVFKVAGIDSLQTTFANDDMSDVIDLTNAFFALPIENLSLDDLQITEEKTINGIPVEEYTDSRIDLTKIIDLSKFDLSKMRNLIFGISIPTMTFIKPINFGVKTIDIQFNITSAGFSWAPVVDPVASNDEAIERLGDMTSRMPVKCVDNPTSVLQVSLDDAKTLIEDEYNTPATNELLKISNVNDFNAAMATLGVQLTKEINVADLAKEAMDTGTFDRVNELDSNVACGILPEFPLNFKPFKPEDLVSIENECCAEEIIEEKTKDTRRGEDETLLDEVPEDTAEYFTSVFEKFLTNCEKCANDLAAAGEEQKNATNAYYWFLEAQLLNNLTLDYVGSRMEMLDEIFGEVTTKITQRDDLLAKNINLRARESSLILEARNRLNLYSGIDTERRINGSNISATTLATIEADLTFINNVRSIRNSISANDRKIATLTSYIDNVKQSNQLLSKNQLSSVLGHSLSSLNDRLDENRRSFKMSTNPITNQVGFNNTLSSISILIDPRILTEAIGLYHMGAVDNDDLTSYIGVAEERTGIYGTLLWNRFYSGNRIDNFFTYQEQGYSKPKPTYSEEGESNSPKSEIKVSNLLGDEETAEVDSDILELEVDQDLAVEFLQTLEEKTKAKVLQLVSTITTSDTYTDYVDELRQNGETEARIIASLHIILQESEFNSYEYNRFSNSYSQSSTGISSNFNRNSAITYKNKYAAAYESIRAFDVQLTNKISQLEDFITLKKGDLAAGEQCIIAQAEDLKLKSDELNSEIAGSSPASGPEKDCKKWLGSDHTGRKPIHDCPDFTKNCYWTEYTKLMQLVSLMPIPELTTSELQKRLFRYYTIGLQIPAISPTGTLPTLAMGTPDPMISIPMPIVWKHIVTLATPLGTIVIWITLCGIIPCPYIMFVDEKGDASFLITLKGPISIPANSLNYSDDDLEPLLAVLPDLKDIFRLNISLDKFKLVGHDKMGTDPDDPKNVISKLQEKLKTSVDNLDLGDWSLAETLHLGPGSTIQNTRDKLRDAMRYFPPDVEIIRRALGAVNDMVESTIDGLSISPIKIPKNPKKLKKPVIGPAEIMDNINAVKDAGLSFPAIKMISLRESVKSLMNEAISSPAVSNAFNKIDEQIASLENSLSYELDEDKKVTERTKLIKEALVKPVEAMSEIATPERLGFLAISIPTPSPVPCYVKKDLPTVPHDYLAMIEAIKDLGRTISEIPDDAFQQFMTLDLTKQLPRMKDVSTFMTEAFMNFVPDLKFPDPESLNLMNMAIKTSIMNLMKIKIRMPHAGGIQVTITANQIKSVIKASVSAALVALTDYILQELIKAIEDTDYEYVVAVLMMIKAILGVDLSDVNGEDIKALISSMVKAVNDALDPLADALDAFKEYGESFKSILSKLFPAGGEKQSLREKIKETLHGKNPLFLEVSTQQMLDTLMPVLKSLRLPFPVVLLACANTASRKVITKVHPFDAREIFPTWEKLTLQNTPYVIWLDQLIATAQRQGGFGSDYVTPYYNTDI